MGDFTKLLVWQKARELVAIIYRLTNSSPINEDFRFRDQLRSAAVSIAANIAEGDELGTNAQSVRHFYIAKGSCAEVVTLLVLAEDIGYLERDIVPSLIEEYRHVSHMLYKLIETRRSPQTKKP